MYQLEQTGKFKKDIKLAKKRGLDMRLLDEVATQRVEKGFLAPKIPTTKKSKPSTFQNCIGKSLKLHRQIGQLA